MGLCIYFVCVDTALMIHTVCIVGLTNYIKIGMPSLLCKGQLISECLFDVFNFPKNNKKIRQVSAVESI